MHPTLAMTGHASRLARAIALLAPAFVVGCASMATDAPEPDPGETADALAGDPVAIEIGFNGPPDQFAYFAPFYAAAKAAPPRRLCHVYVSWKVADDRAELVSFLTAAKDACDDVMISFKSHEPAPVPSTSDVTAAFGRFFAVPWATLSGYTGRFSFTAWNEPNNPASDGSGLGVQIPPEVAARYFLALDALCRSNDCDVAAGDFASNGNMWDDSKVETGTYFARYRREIDAAGVVPKAFAFHGWHDINSYLSSGDHCGTYETCLTRRVLRGMSGSWSKVEIWDNEVGVGQFSTNAPPDAQQACGAAFLVRLTALSARINRMYLTRLRRGPGTLFLGPDQPRPAMGILARRDTTATGLACR